MNQCIDRLGMTDAAFINISETPKASITKPWKMPVSCLRGWQLGISAALRMGSAIALTGCFAITLSNPPALAQIVPDTTLGAESSVVTPNSQVRELPAELIEGGATRGANLFHSFQEFSVGNGQRVYFANPAGIENILTRVTGNNLSNILGTLGVNGGANLFLLNPNGIIFGANAKLDIAGSLVASTADNVVFNNGYQFSAKNPEAPPLLTISLTPGLQYGTNQQPATITNSGNLTVGQNLTLSAGNLDLQGQLQAGGDLTLFAQDIVKVRDSVTNPFVASSGGQLLVQGEHIDIFALNHPNSGLFSVGDMVLRSANTIGGDTHYWSGGSFRIEQLDKSLGDLSSPHDPIILANGDVSLGDYAGASLHILAGGSVTLGNVEITVTDSENNTINPNNPDPFLASLATVPLSDGTTFTIDGSARSTLDVRAGIDWRTLFPAGILGTTIIGTVTPSSTSLEATSANITVNGNIRVFEPNGVVFLTNQYRPNGLAGNVSTQDISTRPGDLVDFFPANGGLITINSRGDITTGNIVSSPLGGIGNGGAITLNATNGNINTGFLESYSLSFSGLFSGTGGAITINSRGNITTGSLDSSSASNSGNAGNGGAIGFTATNGSITTGDLNSFSYSEFGNAGQGGAISFTATNGSITTSYLESFSASSGNAGQGGAISFTAANGSITTGGLDSISVSSGNAGQGGAISFTATNDITITDVLFSYSYSAYGNAGQGGAISLEAVNGSITTGDLLSFAETAYGNAGQGGAISLEAVNGSITTGGLSSYSYSFEGNDGNAGQGGAISLKAANDIITGDLNSDSSSLDGNEGQGGEISLEAVNGSITTGDMDSSSSSLDGNEGQGGAISLEAVNGSITTGSLYSFSYSESGNAGQGGAINLEAANDINITDDLYSFGNLYSFSYSESGTAGQGGAISLITSGGDISGQGNSSRVLGSFSISEQGTAGNGGNVTLEAKNKVSNLEILTLSSSSQSGKVQVTGLGDLLLTNTDILTSKQVTVRLFGRSITLDVGGEGQSGDVAVTNSGNLTFNNSSIQSDTKGSDPAGNVTISSPGLVSFINSQIISNTSSTGQAGSITLKAPEVQLDSSSSLFAQTSSSGLAGSLILQPYDGGQTLTVNLQQGAQISASTSGAGKGGSLVVIAPESITITGNGILSATADAPSTGQAGDVLLTTPQLTIANQARVSASTNSLNASATGGNLTVQSSQVNLTGGSSLSAGTTGVAPGGNLTIQPFANESTLNVNLQDGSVVSASTSGAGKGGTLTVRAPESVTISGNGILSATADASSTGIAGDVLLTTPQLTVTNGARVSASTNSLNSSATGGNLTIQAEQLNLTGKSTIDAGTTGAAPGGNLLIKPIDGSQTLSVNFQDGSIASASSSGSGKGGTLTVTAPESITVSGNGSFISAETSGSGAGGDLNLNTGNLTIRDGAKVTVSSTGTGDAGNLNVNANFVLLENGQLIAETASGEGGNINLNVKDLLLMRNNSLISAQAGNNGNGGNITITNSGFIVAVPREDSDIVADADRGNGGNINITTQGIFGLKFRPQRTPKSDITASSKFGLSGSVTINQLNVDPSRGLAELPVDVVDASRLIDRHCSAGGSTQERGSFTITGRGGLPPSPNDTLQAESLITNWVTLDSQQDKNTPSAPTMPNRSAAKPLTEAQGWMINEKGEVVLTASASQVTPQGEWLPTPECNPSQTVTLPQS